MRWLALAALAAACALQLVGAAEAEPALVSEVPSTEVPSTEEPSTEVPSTEVPSTEAAASAEEVGGIASAFGTDELREKLAQLKTLLAKRSDMADSGLLERLQGLENQLDTLGLGGLGASQTDSADVAAFLGACISMSVTRGGAARRASITTTLKALAADKLSRAQAADNQFLRWVVTCITDLSNAELEQFKAGTLVRLPNSMTQNAEKPEARLQVMSLDDELWVELRSVSKTFFKELAGKEMSLSAKMGLLAAVPVILAVAFLAKKFNDMQQRKNPPKKEKSCKNS